MNECPKCKDRAAIDLLLVKPAVVNVHQWERVEEGAVKMTKCIQVRKTKLTFHDSCIGAFIFREPSLL
jgi:hypothetical protein